MPTKLELSAPRSIVFVSVQDRPPGNGEIRLEAVMSGISHGTELALYRGTSPFVNRRFNTERRLFEEADNPFPMGLGYDWVGRVTDVGPGVARFRPGEMVHLPLPHAEIHLCLEETMLEWGVSGPLPERLSPRACCFLSQMSIALQAVHDARILIGDTVIVFGLGVLGLFTLTLVRLSGAGRIVAVEPDPLRRDLAREWGADEAVDPLSEDPGDLVREFSSGADVSIEFSGNDSALHQAIRALRPGGLCVAAGFYQGGSTHLNLGEEWLHNRITMVASSRGWGNAHREHPRWGRARLAEWAIELLRRESVDPIPLITEVHDYSDAPEVFAGLADGGASLKTVLCYSSRDGGS